MLKWIEREQRYEYLGAEDSRLYSAAKDSTDYRDAIIVLLLERIAGASRAAHQSSKY